MRVVALCPWFDESPAWLAGMVASLDRVGVDHLVAIDGCYELFPGALARPRSSTVQASTILEACEGIGIGCTLVRPQAPFVGNEVEKRNLLFAHGRAVCEEGDWFYCIDSDERVVEAQPDTRELLDQTIWNCAEVRVVTPVEPHGSEAQSRAAAAVGQPHEKASGYRCFFRNLPGLSVELAHYIVGYDAAGGRSYLRGRFDLHDLEPAVELPNFVVEHRTNFRERSRREAAKAYYDVRDACGAERISPPLMMETVDGGIARVA